VKQPINEYELLYLCRENDEISQRALIERYHRAIWAIIHHILPHKPAYIDLDDLYQEGLIALMEAVNNYKEDENASFSTFARVCIEREILSVLRKYSGQSYRLLTHAVSLDMSVSEDENIVLMDTIACQRKEYDPVYVSYVGWAQDQIPKIRTILSDLEWTIYQRHCLGYSYKEISSYCECSEKDVDNTIQKVRKKLPSMFDT